MVDASYVFAEERDAGTTRFAALADLYDAATIRYIEALGIDRGAACLEVGAGGGSIARWLSGRVSPGRVLATDIDTSLLESLALPGVEVERHNIASDPLPGRTFDLAHARLVLMHLPNAKEVIARIVRALKPGGWLVVEEFDVAPPSGNDVGTTPRTSVAFRAVLEKAGVDLAFGRRLPALFGAAGLDHIGAEGRTCLWTGRSAGARLMRANYGGMREAILNTGLVDAVEFTRDLERLGDPQFVTSSPAMWSVWGRRGAESEHLDYR
jgi:SAM-dependent methyltransferase